MGRWVGALLSGRSAELLVPDDVAAVLAVPGVESPGPLRTFGAGGPDQLPVRRRTTDSGSSRSRVETGRHGHSGT